MVLLVRPSLSGSRRFNRRWVEVGLVAVRHPGVVVRLQLPGRILGLASLDVEGPLRKSPTRSVLWPVGMQV